jgi:hypothetical protein
LLAGPDLAWSSYLGGTDYDYGNGIAIDGSGNAWVTGFTGAGGWAVGGFDTSYNGGGDAFIARINADGTLAWSSYLGGTNDEVALGVAIDGAGNAWVTGFTYSSEWVVGGFDTTRTGGDAFITKINADGTLAWSSYLGGNGDDIGLEIAIDGSGNAWVTGETNVGGWAVGGIDTTFNGQGDAFVAKINANGTLAWSSFLGGASGDGGRGIAIDGAGNAWVTGLTGEGTSPVWAAGGFDTSYNGGTRDAFVAKINANGTLAWSSYLGGAADDWGRGIAIDSSENAWVTGYTDSAGWAVGGFDTNYNGNRDAFIGKINANGTLAWSSYLGGTNFEDGNGIAIDGSGRAWMTGETESSGWALGGFDTSRNGLIDAFIAKIIDDVTPPAVTAASYFYETAPNRVRLTFTEDVSPSLSATDLIVTAVPGGAPISVTNFAYDTATNTATFDLLTPLPDGNYSTRLPADSVSDPAGHPLAGDYTFPFFVLAGDADHDRDVDVNDLGILATNWQQSPRTFSQGDFDYSGTVDVNDLGTLATRWQHQLAAPSAPSTRRSSKRLVEQILGS